MRRLFDLFHELRIHLARRHLLRHPTRVNARHFNNLIRARSAGQVARMESKINVGTTVDRRVLPSRDLPTPTTMTVE